MTHLNVNRQPEKPSMLARKDAVYRTKGEEEEEEGEKTKKNRKENETMGKELEGPKPKKEEEELKRKKPTHTGRCIIYRECLYI